MHAVPTQMPSSIGHMRRNSGGSPGPIACQKLVRNNGTASSAAACAGVITKARRPIATVGIPRPTTPFTKPESTNVAHTKARTKIPMRRL